MSTLNEEVNELFVLVRKLEEKQKKGQEVSEQEVQNLKSLTLTLECIAESMIPEKTNKK
jgi:hypothetical protein